MNHRLLTASLLAVALSSCQPGTQSDYFSNCPSGKPEAIFSGDLPGVGRHRFRLRRREAVEHLRFDNGLRLTLVQTGCESIRQDFQFEIPGAFQNQEASFWVAKTVEQFQFLSGLGPKYMMFSSWAQAIAAEAPNLSLSESAQIQPGFYVRIDRVLSPDNATLTVTLSETP